MEFAQPGESAAFHSPVVDARSSILQHGLSGALVAVLHLLLLLVLAIAAVRPEAIAPIRALATIVGGRPGTPMPPWHRFLSEPEAEWIVDRRIEGFPEL